MLAADPTLDRAARARVTYVAIGATSDPQLLRFPPAGYTPFERQVRVGFGERRWGYAVDTLMSWRVKTQAGFRISRMLPHDAGESSGAVPGDGADAALDGRHAVPGETAVLRFLGLPLREPVRVISVIEEERRRGFTYGTLPGHPLEGEEQLTVEWRDDGHVWLVIRSFAKPATWGWRLVAPVLWVIRRIVMIRYADVLAREVPASGA